MTTSGMAMDILITREVAAPGAPAPTEFDPLTGAPLPGTTVVTVTQTVPARRFDPPVRDEVVGEGGLYFGLNDARWIVRQDPQHPWVVNDRFTDEAGATRRIIGIRHAQQQGHVAGGLLEIIGRS